MKINRHNNRLIRFALAGLILAFQPLLAQAATITVCPSGCDQIDVQAAINAARSGDTVQIDSGTYPANLNITKNVTLRGQGLGKTILDGRKVGTVITVGVANAVTVQDLEIVQGRNMFGSGNGGGIINAGSLTVLHCAVHNNDAGNKAYLASGFGAGIWNSGTLNVQNSLLYNNLSFRQAGSVYNSYRATFDQSVIVNSNNHNEIVNKGKTAQLNIINSTLVTGTYEYTLIDNSEGSVALFSSTVAADPNAIYVNKDLITSRGGTLWFSRSIVDSYQSRNCKLDTTAPTTVASGGGNVGTDSSCGLNQPTDLQNVSQANLALGPLTQLTKDTTLYIPLLPGSVAIGRVDCLPGLQDQRGVSRPQGDKCDSGAFELRAPVATNDNFITTQGQAITIPYAALLSNDESPDRLAEGNIVVLNGLTGTKNGTLLDFSSTKNLTYIPNPGFTGQDSFTYTVSDGINISQSATVIINVQNIDHPPVVQNDSYPVFAGQTLTVVPGAGVLANDSDPDNDPLSVGFYTTPDQGALTLDTDGSFTYTPNPGFTGTYSFTYKAFDGRAYSDVATVTFDVKPAVGTITIIEDAQPDSPADFSFSGDLGNFILDNPAIDDGDLYGNSKTFEVTPGTYTISQTKLARWYTGSITCTPLDSTVIDTATNSVQITVGLGDNKTCTFTNQQYGRVKAKVFNDLNKDRRYTGTEPGLLNWKTLLLNPATGKWVTRLTDGNGVAVFPNLKPATYTVCEVLQPGWVSSTPAALDPVYKKPCRKVTVGAGQTVPALFGNSQ